MIDKSHKKRRVGVLRKCHEMLGLLTFLACSSSKTMSAEAFIPNFSFSETRACNSKIVPLNPFAQTSLRSATSSLRSSTSTPSSPTFNDLNEFNAHLETLVRKCGSMNEPVILRAAECQEAWEAAKKNSGERNFEPDEKSFELVLSAWSQSTQALVKSRRNEQSLPSQSESNGLRIDVYTPLDAAKRATKLLFAFPQPSLNAWNIVLENWSRSRVVEAPEAAERLLKRMVDDEGVKPNSNSYNFLIDAWANSGKRNSLDKALQVYRHMEGLRTDQTEDVHPSIRTVNSVLHAYSKKSAQYTSQNNQAGYDEAIKCAAASLSLLEETKKRYKETGDITWQPDAATYTSVMDVHSRCASYETTKIAGTLLDELKEQYTKTGNSRHKPNFRTYTTLVTAWSRTKSDESPQRVEAIMKEMKKCGENPNSRTYTAAVQCWARARDPLKAKRVLKLLMEMREEYKKTGSQHIRPTTLTYNYAIDACARCQGSPSQKTDSVKIAFAILKTIEMDNEIKPNVATYSTLIRALNFLMPSGNERNQLGEAVFEKAKKAGLVDLETLKNLRMVLDAKSMHTALEGKVDPLGEFTYSSIPKEWKKNGN